MEVVEVLVAGDGASRSVQSLRNALAESKLLSQLRDPGADRQATTSAADVTARGAALNAAERMVKDERYGDKGHKYITHQET